MIVETRVTLSRDERKMFATVVNSIGVGFPHYPYGDGTPEFLLMRALNRLARDGSGLDHGALSKAVEALEVQVAQCSIEADVEHWRRVLLKPVAAGASSLPASTAPLVTNPEQVCQALAEARSMQLREALAALAVAREALSQVSPPIPHWTEMEDDDDP